MAFGAITVVNRAKADGPLRADVVTFTGDSSYVQADGYDNFGAAVFDALGINGYTVLAVVPVDTQGYQLTYESSGDELHIWYGNNDGGADGPAVEVAAAADLSAVTFKVLVLSN